MVTTNITQSSPQRTNPPLALIFTDAKGRIVFVDQKFMDLMGYPRDQSLVGEPIHKILRVDQAAIAALLQEVAHTGYDHERSLILQSRSGEATEVLCSSVATYNEQGGFIGADITLYENEARSAQADVVPQHEDVLQARIEQIQVETEAREAEQEQANLQLYFTAQMNALQVLLARMGGPRIHAALEESVNQLAQKKGWAMRAQSGHIVLDEKGLPPEGYVTLLKEVVDYASNIIGRPPVMQEMRMVDAKVGDSVCQAAAAAGLRQLIR